jgi:hypothetical protein
MKRFFLLLFCFVGSLGFSQNSYHFDYVLVYNVSFQDNNFERICYINSNDNDFFTELTHYKDSTNVDFRMIDRDKEISVRSKANKELFFKSEVVNIDCNDVIKSGNPYKHKAKEYDFVNYKDTLINDKLYYHYAIKSNKSTSYIKRKNIAEYHYLVSKNMPNFLPVLIDGTPYEKWKTEKNIPNGVLNTFYMLNFKGEMVYKSELKGFLQQPKSIEFPEDCNPTKLVVKGY